MRACKIHFAHGVHASGVLPVAAAGGKTSAKAHGTMHSWSRLRSTISVFRAAPAQPVKGRRSPPYISPDRVQATLPLDWLFVICGSCVPGVVGAPIAGEHRRQTYDLAGCRCDDLLAVPM